MALNLSILQNIYLLQFNNLMCAIPKYSCIVFTRSIWDPCYTLTSLISPLWQPTSMWYWGLHEFNDDDDNVMCANVWFEFFGGLFWWQNPWYIRGKYGHKEGHVKWANLLCRVWGCKRGSDITEGDITDVRVYMWRVDEVVLRHWKIRKFTSMVDVWILSPT